MKNYKKACQIPMLLAAVGAFALPVHATLVLTFNGAGGAERTQSGSFSIDLSDASTSIILDQGTTLEAPSASGALAGLSGTIDVSFIALGTVDEPFDETAFTGGTTYAGGNTFTSVYASGTTWAGGSDINENVNNFPGQAIVFTFDLTNVVGDTSNLALTAVRLFNDNVNDGARISHLANGAGASTAVYGGGGATSNDETYVVSQGIADGDALALWTAPSSGQRRLRGFTFDVIPEPSVALLGGLGMLAVIGRRRRN